MIKIISPYITHNHKHLLKMKAEEIGIMDAEIAWGKLLKAQHTGLSIKNNSRKVEKVATLIIRFVTLNSAVVILIFFVVE